MLPSHRGLWLPQVATNIFPHSSHMSLAPTPCVFTVSNDKQIKCHIHYNAEGVERTRCCFKYRMWLLTHHMAVAEAPERELQAREQAEEEGHQLPNGQLPNGLEYEGEGLQTLTSEEAAWSWKVHLEPRLPRFKSHFQLATCAAGL